jgi:hypothetical protein
VKYAWQYIGPFLESRPDHRLIFPPFEAERQSAQELSAERKKAAAARWRPRVVK